jgi:hypothetical protein
MRFDAFFEALVLDFGLLLFLFEISRVICVCGWQKGVPGKFHPWCTWM